jgi:hypothetical protein
MFLDLSGKGGNEGGHGWRSLRSKRMRKRRRKRRKRRKGCVEGGVRDTGEFKKKRHLYSEILRYTMVTTEQ